MTWLVINMYLCNQHIVWPLICAKLFYCVSSDSCRHGLGTRLCTNNITVMKIIKSTCTNENKETLGPADLIQINMSCFCINSTQNGSKGQALIKYMT